MQRDTASIRRTLEVWLSTERIADRWNIYTETNKSRLDTQTDVTAEATGDDTTLPAEQKETTAAKKKER